MQQTLPMIGEVRRPHDADPELIASLPTFRSALRHAMNRSGLTQDAVAEALKIDGASFSRMLKEPRTAYARPREFPHEKLSDFMLVTGCLAPLQWLCFQSGREPIALRESKMQRLERELAEERAKAHMALRDAGVDRRQQPREAA
jgi:hypothetical protein